VILDEVEAVTGEINMLVCTHTATRNGLLREGWPFLFLFHVRFQLPGLEKIVPHHCWVNKKVMTMTSIITARGIEEVAHSLNCARGASCARILYVSPNRELEKVREVGEPDCLSHKW
jgi:hypothetical protein